MRVLFIESSRGQNYGGAQTVLLALLDALKKSSIQRMVACVPGSKFEAKCQEMGVETFALPIGSLLNPIQMSQTYRQLTKIVKWVSPDCIVSNDFSGHIYAGPVAKRLGIPLIWWVHGVAVPGLNKTWLAQRQVAKIPATRIISDSLWTQTKLYERVGLVSDVIYYGIDLDRFKPIDSTYLREEFNINENDFILSSIGRLVGFKGHHVFLEAAARSFNGNGNMTYLIVGGTFADMEPNYPQFLKKKAESLGIEEQVIMAGFRDDVPAFYNLSDVFVHATTLHEPFGLTIVEAMALGKPIIATKTGGPEEIIRHGETGFLVEAGNAQEMAHYMKVLAEDETLRTRMGLAGLARVRQLYALPRLAKDFERVLLDLDRKGIS